MKNTMKKLLSLVLVAMLLVSAIPFQAAAAGADVDFKVMIGPKGDDKEACHYTQPLSGDKTETTLDQLLNYWYKGDWSTEKNTVTAYNKTTSVSASGEEVATMVVKAGEAVTVRIVPNDPPKADEDDKDDNDVVVENKLIRFQIKFDDSDTVTYTKIATPENGESTTVKNLLTYWFDANWSKNYKFEHAYSVNNKKTYTDVDTTVYVDDTITIRLSTIDKDEDKDDDVTTTHRVTFYNPNGKAVWTFSVANGQTIDKEDFAEAQEMVGTKSGYTFKGWKINNKGDVYTNTQASKLAIKGNTDFYAYFEKDGTAPNSNKFPYDVYLNIYKDTKVGSPDKRIKITSGIAKDGRVTLEEVKDVVEQYYTAKTSRGISYDGLYLAQGNWVANYIADTQKYSVIEATEFTQYSDLSINVMIGNANAKNAEKADSSNPKTGDMIFVPVIFMLVSGAAIAGVCIYNKKRSAR